MAKNDSLGKARKAKYDEFYTRYEDIESEMNAYYEYNNNVFRDKIILLPCDDPEWSNFTKYFAVNFERFGLKKLISTSYAKSPRNKEFTLFDFNDESFNADIHDTHGRVLIIEKSGIDKDNMKFKYLEGDGDFRSDEVKKLRDEADIIITNPPFSLFSEFLVWIMEAGKEFAVICNQNNYTDKDVFPLIKDNKIWVGAHAGDMSFRVPADSEPRETRFWIDETGQKWRSMGNITWLTNLDHNIRHEELSLMNMEDNLMYNNTFINNQKKKFGEVKYYTYDKYDALDVPRCDAIPSDYSGVMGVPLTFLNKHNPDQFEILDARKYTKDIKLQNKYIGIIKDSDGCINGRPQFPRILIRHRKVTK